MAFERAILFLRDFVPPFVGVHIWAVILNNFVSWNAKLFLEWEIEMRFMTYSPSSNVDLCFSLKLVFLSSSQVSLQSAYVLPAEELVETVFSARM
jgi:hypothetical protein